MNDGLALIISQCHSLPPSPLIPAVLFPFHSQSQGNPSLSSLHLQSVVLYLITFCSILPKQPIPISNCCRLHPVALIPHAFLLHPNELRKQLVPDTCHLIFHEYTVIHIFKFTSASPLIWRQKHPPPKSSIPQPPHSHPPSTFLKERT